MDAASRSSSRSRAVSRPTTPLRPGSRSSVREAHGYDRKISRVPYTQPAINALEPQFADLADRMAELEANFDKLQLMHESLTRFSESFASFLYGLNMNAFCVDFPEAEEEESAKGNEADMTFMTSDTTFIEHPPSTVSTKQVPKPGTSRGRDCGNFKGADGALKSSRAIKTPFGRRATLDDFGLSHHGAL
ncbi:hypothetical protein AN3710.2 [Aspergillus nidulans FGSC A4]|nr:hypothetical protein AN3710.2 [Aspergillus nidulans FGSC A4]|eukprot:XP_661314.1 hypothetical protein AN3710.2 [Aspergillus nidulans FGSC A4]